MSEISIKFAGIAPDAPPLTVRISGGEFKMDPTHGFTLVGPIESLVATGSSVCIPRRSNEPYRCELHAALRALDGSPQIEIDDGLPDTQRRDRAIQQEMKRRAEAERYGSSARCWENRSLRRRSAST